MNTPIIVEGDESTMEREHMFQLALLDSLETAIREDEKNATAYELLQQLVEHTNLHFLSEQLAMRQHAYPGYESHVAEHERLMAEVSNVQDSFNGDHPLSPHELLGILRRWLVDHMQTTDQVLEEYLKQTPVTSDASRN